MKTSDSLDLVQQAILTAVQGNVQIIRQGQFLPAEPGMALQAGDRVLAGDQAAAAIEFTGVDELLVIENGSAATLDFTSVQAGEPAQWLAGDIHGQNVYFEANPAAYAQNSASAQGNQPAEGVSGLFTPSPEADSTGFPILETGAALIGVAAIYDDRSGGSSGESSTGESEAPPPTSGSGGGGGSTEPPPAGETSPLAGLISGLDPLLGALGPAAPVLAPILIPLQTLPLGIASSSGAETPLPIPLDPTAGV